ncbi:MAG: hypothetical protein QM715_10310 [Nibricoccus sp.]
MKMTSIKSTPACWLKGFAPLALVLSFGLIQATFAQTTVTPDITERVRPAEESLVDLSGVMPAGRPLYWGPFVLHPQILYRFVAIDGIQSQPGVASKTNIHTFIPELAAELGSHWTFRYAQTWSLYSNSDFHDSLEQALSAYWNTKYDIWTLTASHTSSFTNSIMVETAQQTKVNVHNTMFNAYCAMGRNWALESAFTQNLTNTSGNYEDPHTWTFREMLHRQASVYLDTAIGTQYSFTALRKADDMAALQFLGSITFRPIHQVSLSAQAGLENRRVYSEPSVNVRTPVYTVTLQIAPVNRTQFGATASRSTAASFLDGQLTESTQYGFNFQQILFKRMQFTAGYNRQETEYRTTRNPTITGRKDTADSVSAALGTSFLTRLRVALSYQRTNNLSNVALFQFKSTQFGFEIGYSY